MSNRNEARRKAAASQPVPEPATESKNNSLLNFTVPTEIVDLPSRGIFYPSGHPLHGKTSVEIRYMTAKDEDILTSPALLRKGIAIERMIDNLLVDNNISSKDMLVGDRNALIYAARITGYGREYDAGVECPSCEREYECSFDLAAYVDAYKFTDPDESEFAFTGNGTLEVELPKTKVLVEIRALTGTDEDKMTKLREMKVKNNLNDAPLTDLFKTMVVSANGIVDKGQIAEFIDNMPALDSKFLRAAYNKVMPNIEFSQAVECPHCGYATEMAVPITAKFFWP